MSEVVDQETLAEFNKMSKRFEESERLGTAWGPDGIGMNGYTWLLAYFILRDDPTKAKILWSQLPVEMKNGHPEYQAVWTVGNRLWERDPYGFFEACHAYRWTPKINKMIEKMKERFRRDMIREIDGNYEEISAKDLGTLLGLDGREVARLVRKQDGWEFKEERGWCGRTRMVWLNGGEGKPTYHYRHRYTEEDVKGIVYLLVLIFLLIIFWVVVIVLKFWCNC